MTPRFTPFDNSNKVIIIKDNKETPSLCYQNTFATVKYNTT